MTLLLGLSDRPSFTFARFVGGGVGFLAMMYLLRFFRMRDDENEESCRRLIHIRVGGHFGIHGHVCAQRSQNIAPQSAVISLEYRVGVPRVPQACREFPREHLLL